MNLSISLALKDFAIYNKKQINFIKIVCKCTKNRRNFHGI
jgi:hypothetical protein